MNDLLKLLNEIAAQGDEKILPDTELIMSGVLDSMNIATLIAYIEHATGRELPIGDLDLAKLSTPEDIAANFLRREGV